LVLLASALQACATNPSELSSCLNLAKTDPSKLGFVVGMPVDRFAYKPTMTFFAPSRASASATLTLELTQGPIAWPSGLNETSCKGLDWRTYRFAADPGQWSTFWAQPREGTFEAAFAVTDDPAPLNVKKFGFALVDVESDKVLMSCGCYET